MWAHSWRILVRQLTPASHGPTNADFTFLNVSSETNGQDLSKPLRHKFNIRRNLYEEVFSAGHNPVRVILQKRINKYLLLSVRLFLDDPFCVNPNTFSTF